MVFFWQWTLCIFILLSDSFKTSSFMSLFEIFSIKDFLVDSSVTFLSDSLMWLFISPNSTFSSYSLSSGLILMNLQPTSSFIFFLFHFLFLHLSHYVLFHQLLLLIYARENANQFYNSKHCFSSIFSFGNNFVIFDITDCSLHSIISCCLRSNLDLNLIASSVDTLQLIILGIIISP